MAVVITATIIEFCKAERKTGLTRISRYQRRESPRIGKLIAGDELKENNAMMAMGKNRYRITRTK
jgi:hypothetical protein